MWLESTHEHLSVSKRPQLCASPRALSSPRARRLAAQLALFALAGLALATQQLHPALQAAQAALDARDHAAAVAAFLQVRSSSA